MPPPRSRLAQMREKSEAKRPDRRMLWIGVGAAAVVILGVVIFMVTRPKTGRGGAGGASAASVKEPMEHAIEVRGCALSADDISVLQGKFAKDKLTQISEYFGHAGSAEMVAEIKECVEKFTVAPDKVTFTWLSRTPRRGGKMTQWEEVFTAEVGHVLALHLLGAPGSAPPDSGRIDAAVEILRKHGNDCWDISLVRVTQNRLPDVLTRMNLDQKTAMKTMFRVSE